MLSGSGVNDLHGMPAAEPTATFRLNFPQRIDPLSSKQRQLQRLYKAEADTSQAASATAVSPASLRNNNNQYFAAIAFTATH